MMDPVTDDTAYVQGFKLDSATDLTMTGCTFEPTQGSLATMPRLRPVRQEHRTENGQDYIRLWMGEQEPPWAYQVEFPEPPGPDMGGHVVVFEVVWPARVVPSLPVVTPQNATLTYLDMAPAVTSHPQATGPLPDVIAGAEFWAGIEGGYDDEGEDRD
jgi:hypothetical protein